LNTIENLFHNTFEILSKGRNVNLPGPSSTESGLFVLLTGSPIVKPEVSS